MMHKSTILSLFIIIGSACAFAADRPNVVFILADDLGLSGK